MAASKPAALRLSKPQQGAVRAIHAGECEWQRKTVFSGLMSLLNTRTHRFYSFALSEALIGKGAVVRVRCSDRPATVFLTVAGARWVAEHPAPMRKAEMTTTDPTTLRLTPARERVLREIAAGRVYRARFDASGRCHDSQQSTVTVQVHWLVRQHLAEYLFKQAADRSIPIGLTSAGRAWLDAHPKKEN